jgi:hypothetical protein
MAWTEDGKMFFNIINKGIDSRLEAFTKSKAYIKNNRLYMEIHPDEVQLLLRRLSDDDSVSCDFSEEWIDDILNAWYGVQNY